MGIGSPTLHRKSTACLLPVLASAARLGAPGVHADVGLPAAGCAHSPLPFALVVGPD